MRKILIAVPYLNSGGVEVSLIRFLTELSKDKNNKIDLLMLKKEGIYLSAVPNCVNIISLSYDNEMYSYDRKFNDVKEINGLVTKLKFIFFRFKLKKCIKNDDWESYYKLILSHVNDVFGDYDLAIDWHGYGHFITSVIAEKVQASKKIFWVHDEKNDWLSKVECWLKDFDKIFCVGISCMNNVAKQFPFLKEKLDVFYNIIDYKSIREKSLLKEPLPYENKFNIITVGRLEWQKGYDIAVEIASKLKKAGRDFCWYVIGDGHKRKEIEKLIFAYDIDDCFKLLGQKKNPFPFIKGADMFVLSSRHEGYCTVILETKILGKVILATDIPSNKEQIKPFENGLLCPLDAEAFANMIMKVMDDSELRKKIEGNLAKENFDYTNQMKKIYDLMEE